MKRLIVAVIASLSIGLAMVPTANAECWWRKDYGHWVYIGHWVYLPTAWHVYCSA